MHGAFCDQPRPENDPRNDPDLSCTMPSGNKADTVRLPDVLRRCGTFSRYGKIIWGILPGLKKISKREKKGRDPGNFLQTREKDIWFITTLNGAGQSMPDSTSLILNSVWPGLLLWYCFLCYPFAFPCRLSRPTRSRVAWRSVALANDFLLSLTARPSVTPFSFGVLCRRRNLAVQRCGSGFRGAASSTHVLARGIGVSTNFP